MSDHLAIRVEKIGKQYDIAHRTTERARHYSTLRDAISARFQRSQPALPPVNGGDGTFWALRDVSFEVGHGEVIGLIGRNGAGKSTLLKILARITDPSEGTVEIRGRVASLLEVGTGFHPELSGRENVYLSGAISGMRKAEIDQLFDEIVDFAEVEKFIDTPVKRYSSGMHVRLAFAVAAHLTSEIMLVDEVLAVGDIAFQQKCLGKISDVSQRGRTIVLVSHRMDSVRTLCQVAYWIDGGRLRSAGPVNEITQSYEEDMLVKAHDTQTLNVSSEEHGIEVYTVSPCLVARGDAADLQIEISGRAFRPIARMGVALDLRTLDGVLVSRVNSNLAGVALVNLSGDWHGTFVIPDITARLSSGDYVLRLMLYRPQFGLALSVDNAAVVHIPYSTALSLGSPYVLQNHGLLPLQARFTSPNMGSIDG